MSYDPNDERDLQEDHDEPANYGYYATSEQKKWQQGLQELSESEQREKELRLQAKGKERRELRKMRQGSSQTPKKKRRK